MAKESGKKKIAVISGKGGTGKTTVAVNLAYIIAREGRVVRYIDCDVEEPNGHIFLAPEFKQQEDVFVKVPEVDLEKCTGCGKCSDICQYGAIVSLKKNVMVFDELCHGCGGCSIYCPTGAIKERSVKIGVVRNGASGHVDFWDGVLEIGSVRTPGLISDLKAMAVNDGINILDCPPGASCSAVASVKDADYALVVTEPTPFGLNDMKIVVKMIRRMGIDFGVVVNRFGLGDDGVIKYCQQQNIEIIAKLKDMRKAAEVYSRGELLVDKIADFGTSFKVLSEKLGVADA